LAAASAGSNKAARMAMMMITTSNSIRVKALGRRGAWPVEDGEGVLCVFIVLSLFNGQFSLGLQQQPSSLISSPDFCLFLYTRCQAQMSAINRL
jgi:hypothetical protein